MNRIDAYVLDHVEAAAHWIQREVGVNCIALRRLALWLYLAAIAMRVIASVLHGKVGGDEYFDCFCLLTVLPSALRMDVDENLADSCSERTANPNRYVPFLIFMRVSILTATAVWFLIRTLALLGPDLDCLQGSALIAYLYLDACSPLPPCRGRFWEALRARMQPATAGASA